MTRFQRWERSLIGAVAFAVVAAIVAIPPPANAASWHTWTGTVTHIVDGDTFDVNISGATKRIRLAGINTNELGQCQADVATDRLAQLIDGKVVTLKARDPSSQILDRDLRHVFLGSQNIAVTMLEGGYGIPTIFNEEPDWKITYTTAATEAKDAGLRVWDFNACGSGPASSADIEMVTNWDAAGQDASNINGEWVQLRNRGSATVNLNNWRLRDSGLDDWYFPSGKTLAPGARLRIHIGSGSNTSTDLYMGNSEAILWNTADGMYLHDPDDDIRAFDFWPCIGTCGPIDPLIIDHVNYNAPGNDLTNPNGEWIRIRNVGFETVDFQDWMLETPGYMMTSIASRPLSPGQTLTVYMGSGSNTSTKMYWGKSKGVLGNSGDEVLLYSPHRDLVDCVDWGSVECDTVAIGSKIDLTANWDASGNDLTNPNGEWVNLTNRSSSSLSLTGFKLSSPPHTYSFPSGTSIAPGARLRVKVGTGSNSTTTKYWGKSTAILGNSGDVVHLVDPGGTTLRTFAWPCSGVCGPVPQLIIDEVNYDAPGNDLTNPNGEWIRIRNVSTEIIDLRDWQILSPPYQINPTASRKMDPGDTVKIYIGSGTNTSTKLYWGKSSAILTNSGDSVRLLTPHRDIADCSSWGSSSCPSVESDTARLTLTAHYDAAGDDLANPNGEWINVANVSGGSMNLNGYQISSPGHLYTIGGSSTLSNGERLRLYIGSGSTSRLVRRWGKSTGILGNSGDTVTLVDPEGRVVRHIVWPCGGECGPIPDLKIVEVNYDAAGNDSTNPNGEWVKISNPTKASVDLRDWSVFSSPHVYDFDTSVVIPSQGTVKVYIGSGNETSTKRYWGHSYGILGNSGDAASLVAPSQDVVSCKSWGSGSC